MVTARSVIALATAKHWTINQMNVYNTFWQGDLTEEVFMCIPPGVAGSNSKSLYVCKPVNSPLELNAKLTTLEFDTHTSSAIDDTLLVNPGPYQSLLGRLLYLTITRPDISFTVQTLS
ncbi:PREDICTED: uncharacterized protein LOC109225932 [Nicotiana attenuata]|uniref:uncharacterized protein LOC109225932 n=1 Tax=Nicotiana attenuata TaxID=49451 RepID=UPI000905C8D8|nr:PREDICTED: uncharacterized protein LOC109225932 [Nicotiana attenuata]